MNGKCRRRIQGQYSRDCELIRRYGRLNEFEDTVDGLQRVVKVGRIVPPLTPSEGFPDLEGVDTAYPKHGQRHE
jgi:hypothetical protein